MRDRTMPDAELVHRLDRETSGCLLVAKRRAALRDLHVQLREGADGEALPGTPVRQVEPRHQADRTHARHRRAPQRRASRGRAHPRQDVGQHVQARPVLRQPRHAGGGGDRHRQDAPDSCPCRARGSSGRRRRQVRQPRLQRPAARLRLAADVPALVVDRASRGPARASRCWRVRRCRRSWVRCSTS